VGRPRRVAPLETHSVAFRVTAEEWQKLMQAAERTGSSIPRIAREALFQKLRLRSGSGQARRKT
jgi:hypothetical protein